MAFDLTVHHRDPKSGRVVNTTPYQMICSKEKGTYFVRNGQKFNPDGSLMEEKKPVAEVVKDQTTKRI